MGMIDPFAEPLDEDHWIDPLPDQMARVEVEAELLLAVYCFDRLLSRLDVVCLFLRMHLVSKLDPMRCEEVKNLTPTLSEQLKALLKDLLISRWEYVPCSPIRGASEPVDHRHVKRSSRLDRLLHPFGTIFDLLFWGALVLFIR
jgi:hypothetical protein